MKHEDFFQFCRMTELHELYFLIRKKIHIIIVNSLKKIVETGPQDP